MIVIISCLIQTAILKILLFLNITNINEIKNLKTCKDKKSLFLFHFNICSLPKNFEDFQYLIQLANIYFDAIIISESRINKNNNQSLT